MKVSFDYDGTLSRRGVQDYAKELINRGLEVWIVTSRYSNERAQTIDCLPSIEWNADLHKVATELGIDFSRIYFTNMESKDSFFRKEKDFVFHLDDSLEECSKIYQHSPVIPISANKGSWKGKCEKLLAKENRSRIA